MARVALDGIKLTDGQAQFEERHIFDEAKPTIKISY
jgi:hypothetical protein